MEQFINFKGLVLLQLIFAFKIVSLILNYLCYLAGKKRDVFEKDIVSKGSINSYYSR